jgi:hypothetical protein
MEPESSLPYSQVPATCPYPEPAPSSPHNPLPLPEDTSLRISRVLCIYVRLDKYHNYPTESKFELQPNYKIFSPCNLLFQPLY